MNIYIFYLGVHMDNCVDKVPAGVFITLTCEWLCAGRSVGIWALVSLFSYRGHIRVSWLCNENEF